MNTTELVTALSIALTVIALALTIWKGRRPSPIRPILDVARVIVQSAIAVAIPIITAVVTDPILMVGPVFAGLVLGLLQGRRLQVQVDQARLYSSRSMAGLAIWAIGLVLMQAAGLANRAGIVEVGQAITWFSIGISAGLILGRHAAVRAAIDAVSTRTAPLALVLIMLLGACDAFSFATTVQPDGSGTFELGVGFDPEEGEPDCIVEPNEDYAYDSARIENRGDGLIWCVLGTSFADLNGLRTHQQFFNNGEVPFFTTNCFAFAGDLFVYDVTLMLAENEEGVTVPFSVTVPGRINSTNADDVDGATATWFLREPNQAKSIKINAADDGKCPAGGVDLRLTATGAETGRASLAVQGLASGQSDTDRVAASLTANGWPAPSSAAGGFVVERTWTSSDELKDLIASIPPIEDSDIDLVVDDASGAVDFDFRLDLSFYENYWQGINPELEDPAFSFTYVPFGAISSTSGAWTDAQALRFDWDVDSSGRIFPLFASSGVEEATSSGNGDDDDDDDDNDEGRELTTPEQQAQRDLEELLDDENVSENEALQGALAGLLAAAGVGALTFGEALGAGQTLVDAAERNRAERERASPDPTPPVEPAAVERPQPPPEPPPKAPAVPEVEPEPLVTPVVPEPAPAARTEPEPDTQTGRGDPCAQDAQRFDDAARTWRKLELEAAQLRTQYHALELQWHQQRMSGFFDAAWSWGNAVLGISGWQPPTPGMISALRSSVGASLKGFVKKELARHLALGDDAGPLDMQDIVNRAKHSVVGTDHKTGDIKVTGGMVEAFVTHSATSLAAAWAHFDYKEYMESLGTGLGSSDPAVQAALDKAGHEAFFQSVAASFDRIWTSGKMLADVNGWGKGVADREKLLQQKAIIHDRLSDLNYELDEAERAMKSFRRHLANCRSDFA